MIAVFKRELKSYLTSPVGYSYLFIFLLATGFFFYVNNIIVGSTDTIGYFAYTRYLLIIILPLLAMKLFPEERKNKTDQVLITSPVSIPKIVIGKFLAAYAMFAIGLVPTLINMIFLANVGYLEWGIVAGNYIGLLFIAAAFLAIAMLMSVLTESMITAFIMGAFTLALFAVADLVSQTLNITILNKIVSVVSVTSRYEEFNQGLFNISTIIYFLSLAVIFIFLTIRVIDKRRWS